jgi:diguanylate cyclase (GGDEF)-like protein
MLRLLTAKRISLPALAVLLACGRPFCASEEPVAATLRAVTTMNSSSCQRPLVSFEGIVTHARPSPNDFFVQQDGAGLFVENPTRTQVAAGDRVRVEGSVNCDLHPSIHASRIVGLGRTALPAPIPATFSQLIEGRYDAVLVKLRGSVRSADPSSGPDPARHGAIIRMMADGGPVDVVVHNNDGNTLETLLDADVEVTGIAEARQDGKQQRTGVVLYAGSLANVHVLHRAAADPWNLPPTAMDTIMSAYFIRSLTRRVRVHGTVTYVEPGRTVVLQEGPRSLLVNTESPTPLQVGDEVDAIGFPLVNDSFLVLSRAELRTTGRQHLLSAQPQSWNAIYSGRHSYDLVSIDGYVVHEMHGATEDSYVMAADGKLFGAIFRHPANPPPGSAWPRPVEKNLPIGAQVRLTGVCFPIDSYNHNASELPFNIMLRSADDVQLLKGPSLVNTRNLGVLTVVLLFMLVLLSARFWRTERRVRREMARLAYSERRRSRILEQINGSVPLAEIVEQTSELVSFRLQGAPCWVHIDGGANLGIHPKKLSGFRVVELPIPSRSGATAGTIYAAIDQLTPPTLQEKDALSMAAGLVELAIETRKTYTDLVHRSEFDQLTNVQNRFSLERSLDQQIRQARAQAGIFGLIYIDLNGFKKVNDLYGHLMGDRFLQEISLRMKRQLRPGDLLARLGGDEFSVLVPEIHSRTEVEEIASRMERCFDEPFAADGCSIQGSAAIGIALYPEDGRSREALLRSADAAMYLMKHARSGHSKTLAKSAGVTDGDD